MEDLLSIVQTKIPSESINLKVKPPRFINGYFQSSKLVEDNWHIYNNELFLAIESTINLQNLDEVEQINQKMIHIRRGDFVENRNTVGLLSLEYFANQIEITERVTIFTDSKSNDLEIGNTFPESLVYGADSIDTWTSFSLLSRARHLIISNSTFSWWAGLICNSRGGRVSAPDPWTLTNVYGDNYLKNSKFDYRNSIFEKDPD
jgi:hypothetical protein